MLSFLWALALNLIKMTTEEVKAELKNKKADDRKNGYHMMATKAYHQLGEISSDTPDICFIYSETKNHYVGNWVFGFGFFDVLFPKETTKEMTQEDIKKYDGKNMAINSTPIGKLNVVAHKNGA